jgi:hypothetical protein
LTLKTKEIINFYPEIELAQCPQRTKSADYECAKRMTLYQSNIDAALLMDTTFHATQIQLAMTSKRAGTCVCVRVQTSSIQVVQHSPVLSAVSYPTVTAPCNAQHTP